MDNKKSVDASKLDAVDNYLRKEDVQSAILNRHPNIIKIVSRYLGRHFGSHERADEFLCLAADMDAKQFWTILHREWPGFDAIDHSEFEWMLSRFSDEWNANYLAVDDKLFYNSLPDEVTIYRGQSANIFDFGLSWTTDYDVAMSFALGHRGHKCPDPIILKAVISKQDIAGAYAEREESEILLFSLDDLQIIEKIEIPQRKIIKLKGGARRGAGRKSKLSFMQKLWLKKYYKFLMNDRATKRAISRALSKQKEDDEENDGEDKYTALKDTRAILKSLPLNERKGQDAKDNAEYASEIIGQQRLIKVSSGRGPLLKAAIEKTALDIRQQVAKKANKKWWREDITERDVREACAKKFTSEELMQYFLDKQSHTPE